MGEKLYLDWEGLVLYHQQISLKILDTNNSIKDGKLVFTKNGDEISSFSANQDSDNVIEILNDLDIINIIKYGQSDISELTSIQLELKEDEMINSLKLADVAKSGDYNDLINVPTKVSLFENDKKYLETQNVTPITYGSGELDNTKLIDILFNN